MPRCKIKVTSKKDKEAWLVRYKQVGFNEYKVDLSYDASDAGLFDEDDYIINLCEYWFVTVDVLEA